MQTNNTLKRPSSSRKKQWLFVVTALVILGIAAGLLVYTRHQAAEKAKPPLTDKITYASATKEEQAASDKQKQADLNQESTPPPTTASVNISDANQYDDTVEVRAYVSNAVEDGGTCTTVFTKGTTNFSVDTKAFKDASTTQCGAIDVARSKFSASGKWSVIVRYASPSISGQSQPSQLDIK
jgi:hypothetical protein